MRHLAWTLLLWVVVGASHPAYAQDDARQVVQDMKAQLNELRTTVQQLQAENQRLQAALMHQQRVDTPAGTGAGYEGIRLYGDSSQFPLFSRPGAAPPSWLDILIEQNRQRTLEALNRQRDKERLSDERLTRIVAESRAIGVNYAPRPLREGVLAGGDPKALRDELVSARSSDFDALFNQPPVKEYLQHKAAGLQGQAALAAAGAPGGTTAGADVRQLAEKLRRDLADTTRLFGSDGNPPGGFEFGVNRTRELRDSASPRVSGPTRDALELSRRSALVDAAVAGDMDIDMAQRLAEVRQANRRMIESGYAPSPELVAQDLAQVANVLNGKIVRTAVPQVHAFKAPEPPKN